MEYSLLDRDNTKKVVFYGNLQPSSRAKFLEIAKGFETSSQKEWELDVAEFDYIDSSGLGMLIELNEEAQKHGVKISLSGANDTVLKMFKLSRFELLFNIVE